MFFVNILRKVCSNLTFGKAILRTNDIYRFRYKEQLKVFYADSISIELIIYKAYVIEFLLTMTNIKDIELSEGV